MAFKLQSTKIPTKDVWFGWCFETSSRPMENETLPYTKTLE